MFCGAVGNAQKKSLKAPDIWLNAFTSYFLWPPAFGDQGEGSRCFTDRRDLGTDLYCSTAMRSLAARLGRTLPQRGCPIVDVLTWQVDELSGRLASMRGERQGRRL